MFTDFDALTERRKQNTVDLDQSVRTIANKSSRSENIILRPASDEDYEKVYGDRRERNPIVRFRSNMYTNQLRELDQFLSSSIFKIQSLCP
jgi:hypothetical protein